MRLRGAGRERRVEIAIAWKCKEGIEHPRVTAAAVIKCGLERGGAEERCVK